MDCKSFLFSWCRKKKVVPRYDIRATGPQHRQRFLCEVHIDGIAYIGTGNSTTKREARVNGARDMINYLVNSGEISDEEVPDVLRNKPPPEVKSEDNPEKEEDQQEGAELQGTTNESTEQSNQTSDSQNENVTKSSPQKKKVKQAQSPGSYDSRHGNWTIENAKSKLHQYFQINKISAEYKYKAVGPDHTRRFRCDLSIYVRELGRNVNGRATGSNKLMASKSCALSIVRQLFHRGVIEAYSGTLRKDRSTHNMSKSYPVAIDPALEEKLQETLEELGIKPVDVGTDTDQPTESETAVSLMVKDNVEAAAEAKPTPGEVPSWTPPQPNWNAWTGCNIDEGPFFSPSLDGISADLEKQYQEVRRNNVTYQECLREREQLPVYATRSQIMEAINDNPVIIIKGNTGCGKTTQVCQFILDDYIASGQGAWANVCVTQPRRVTAMNVAERIANERCEELGNSIGYSVRFESVLPRPYGSIMFCTVDVLLRKLVTGLNGVSHVIVDEVHERDANTDFELILLRDMVEKYPDLRVILLSAFVDTTLFEKYFGDCPVIEVPSTTYPVTQYFLEDFIELTKFDPPHAIRKRKVTGKKVTNSKEDEGDDEEEEPEEQFEDLNENCNLGEGYSKSTSEALQQLSEKDFHFQMSFELVEEILKYVSTLEKKGAVLVFLPGWNLIFALLKHLTQHTLYGDTSKYMILPLHSQIPNEDMKKVFVPPPEGVTKVILSTNIAETSMTINDVVYVIDSCKAKTKVFTSHNNMTSYATVWASKTNLEQRKAHAARVEGGVCFTLCSKARFEKFEQKFPADIFRSPLYELGLSIKLLRLGAIGHFLSKAPEPPPLDAVIEAEALLRELGCLDANDALTPLGTILAKLPIEPRLGKMLLLGLVLGVGDAVTTIAANSTTLAEVVVVEKRRRVAPLQNSLAGDRASDHVAMLNAFQMWEKELAKGEGAVEEWCESAGVDQTTLRMTAEAKKQLTKILTTDLGFPEECFTAQEWNPTGPDPTLDLIIALICMGLYPNVCIHRGKREVLTPEGKSALINKPSVNCRSNDQKFPSPLFVFGEKLRFRAISCKQTTMVAPLHVLLFGCNKVEWVDEVVRLDNWLNFKMSARSAALVTALRPGVEKLVERAAAEPDAALNFSPVEQKVVSCLRDLCVMNAGDYNIIRDLTKNSQDDDFVSDPKKAKTEGTEDNDDGCDQNGVHNANSSGKKQRGSAKRRARGNRRGYLMRVGTWNRNGYENRGGYRNRRGFGNRGGYANREFGNQGGYENRGFGNRGYGIRGFRSRGGYGNRGSFGYNGGYAHNDGYNDGYGNDGYADDGYGNDGYGNDGYGNDGYANDDTFTNDGGFYRRRYSNQNKFGNQNRNYRSGQDKNDWPELVHEW